MSENEKKICPVCGTPMEPSNLDGTFRLDGSVDLSGWKCPKCSAIKPESTAKSDADSKPNA